MTNDALSLIERRRSINHFDPSHSLSDDEIERLARLATRAPSAYNLQNWRLIAVRTPAEKQRLRLAADNQTKIYDAAVAFIICGLFPDPADVARHLQPLVQAGHMAAKVAMDWQQSASQKYSDPQTARDEAVRSATLAAATLIYAAEAMSLSSCPLVGFDAQRVAAEFRLKPNEIPVVLVAVGRAAPENWPQKPRRPLRAVLEIL